MSYFSEDERVWLYIIDHNELDDRFPVMVELEKLGICDFGVSALRRY